MSINLNDKILDFIYGEALKDATIRNTCSSDVRKQLVNFENDNNNIGYKIKELVHNYISDINNGKLNKNSCIDTIEKICEVIKNEDEKGFSFGNAQKLVNMSAKYFYISTLGSSKKQREKFKYCHCPMDRKMIKKLTNKDAIYWEIIHEGGIKNRQEINKKAWSRLKKEDKKQYMNYQKGIGILLKSKFFIEKYKEGLYPIEADYLMWRYAYESIEEIF